MRLSLLGLTHAKPQENEWLGSKKAFDCRPLRGGFHLITHLIEEHCEHFKKIKIGLAHIFIHHTSTSLTLNENADPSVRTDFESRMNTIVPKNTGYYVHDIEGPDDMPAHIKASLMGFSVTIPIHI